MWNLRGAVCYAAFFKISHRNGLIWRWPTIWSTLKYLHGSWIDRLDSLCAHSWFQERKLSNFGDPLTFCLTRSWGAGFLTIGWIAMKFYTDNVTQCLWWSLDFFCIGDNSRSKFILVKYLKINNRDWHRICTEIHGSQMMYPNDFGDTLTSSCSCSGRWDFWLNCLDSYWSDLCNIWWRHSCSPHGELTYEKWYYLS